MVPVGWYVEVTDIELMRFSVMVIKYATVVFHQEKQYLHDQCGVRRTGKNEY
jgi:hypothetical protein